MNRKKKSRVRIKNKIYDEVKEIIRDGEAYIKLNNEKKTAHEEKIKLYEECIKLTETKLIYLNKVLDKMSGKDCNDDFLKKAYMLFVKNKPFGNSEQLNLSVFPTS